MKSFPTHREMLSAGFVPSRFSTEYRGITIMSCDVSGHPWYGYDFKIKVSDPNGSVLHDDAVTERTYMLSSIDSGMHAETVSLTLDRNAMGQPGCFTKAYSRETMAKLDTVKAAIDRVLDMPFDQVEELVAIRSRASLAERARERLELAGWGDQFDRGDRLKALAEDFGIARHDLEELVFHPEADALGMDRDEYCRILRNGPVYDEAV